MNVFNKVCKNLTDIILGKEVKLIDLKRQVITVKKKSKIEEMQRSKWLT